MARDAWQEGMSRRPADVVRESVFKKTIDELVGITRIGLAGELRAAEESCRRAGRTGESLFLATGIHEHGDPCVCCGRPGEEVEPWWPSAVWLDRLGCPAGHPGSVMILVCRACCETWPSPHGGDATNPTREAILGASRGSGPLARWMTEAAMKRFIVRDQEA